MSIPSKLCIPTIEKKFHDHSELEKKSAQSQTSNNGIFKGLDSEQIRSVEVFLSDLDNLIREVSNRSNHDPRRDEDLIILITLKHFVTRYFNSPNEPTFSSDVIAKLMKAKINTNEMIMVLSSIKFRDKNSDMILVTVKQFNDIFLELIINPNSFKSNQISFFRGGKSIINIFIFLIKNFFQQIRIMKSIYIEDALHPESMYLFSDDTSVDVLKTLVNSSLELSAIDSQIHIPINNPASAFQLHSQKHSRERQEMGPPEVNNESEGLIVSGNILDKACRLLLTL